MEAYLEALDVGILRAASQGFPKPRDATNLQGDEVNVTPRVLALHNLTCIT